MDNFDLRKFLAEGRLFEELNPIWVINSSEDSADIEQAGPAYKEAVINIIKSKHSDISDKDLEASIEVMNDTWYNKARSNAKGSNPEDIKVSAEDFAGGAIEHYEDALMPSNSSDQDLPGESLDTFDKKLDYYLEWNGIPNLNDFSERHRNQFRNYAEKYLKPSNASDEEIMDAMRKYTSKYYDTKDI